MKPRRRIHKLNALACAFSSAIVFSMVSITPSAQALTWDTVVDGPAITGGNGNWSDPNLWNDGAGVNQTWVDGNVADLTTGSGTVTLTSAVNAATLTLTNYTLNGAFTLTAATYNLSSATVDANLGAGTMLVTDATTLNGTSGAGIVNVNGGALNLGASDRLSDVAALTIASGATVGMGTFTDTVGELTLSGGTLDGTGTLTAATYTLNGGTVNAVLGAGAIIVNTGTTDLGSAGRLNSTSSMLIQTGQLTLGGDESVGTFQQSGGTLAGAHTLTSFGAYNMQAGTVSANLGGTIGLTKTTAGTTILSGTNTYSGETIISGGNLTLSGGGVINHSAANLTIGLNSGENATLNVNTGSVSANELYVGYTGNGVLNLSNGTVTNTKGFIGVNSPSVSSAYITGGQWSNTGELTVGYGGTGSLEISGTGTVNSAGAYFGFLAASDGNTATIAGPDASWTSDSTFYLGHDGSNNTVTVSGGALLANTVISNGVNNADFLIGSNAGSDNNKLTVTGTGSRFTNDWTFYVGRNGTGNQFEVLAGGSATSFNVRIGGGSGSVGTTEYNEATVDGAGSLWNVTGTMRIGATGDNSSLTISDGGSVTTTGNSFLGYSTGSDNNLVTITGVNSTWTANDLYIGRLGVNNTVTVENDGTLSANNIRLGDQLGSSGALQIGNGSNATVLAAQISEGLGNGTVTFSGGTLRLTGNQANLFSDFETGDVTLIGSGGGTIDTQAFSVATGYSLSGNGTLTKQGVGTLTLSGANTYSGVTTISAGILQVDSNDALGTNAAGTSVTSGAALVLNGVTYSTVEALSINGTGVSNGGALVNSGTSSYAGQITAATDASINAGGGTLTLSGGLVKDATTLTLTGGGIINIDTVGISGASANSDLVVDGVTVNANVANSYNGPTFIRSTAVAGSGILNANATDALPTLNGRSAVTMDDMLSLGGSQLTLSGGFSQSIASLTGVGGLAPSLVNLNANTLTIGAGAVGSTTFDGVISGTNGNLIKDGVSTQIISGVNTYTGTTTVNGGTLDLTGSILSNTTVNAGGTFRGTGTVNGNLTNNVGGTLAAGTLGNPLNITGSLVTNGTVALTVQDVGNFDQIQVGGNASFNGALTVTNSGAGLASGQVAQIIFAGSYSGSFTTFNAIGFTNGVVFNNTTGELIGLAGGTGKASKTYLNLTENQTNVFLALYEDSVQLGVQNVTRVYDPNVPSYTINFTGGISDGDPLLVAALNEAVFTNPGTIFAPVINLLSPEVHRGMVDYTEQALRSHVRDGVDAAPISRNGKTQVFATLQTSGQGAEDAIHNAGYDINITSLTTGVRYDVDSRLQIGGMLGVDDGSIEGALIDTEAQGLMVGIFGRYLVDEASKTKVTASLSYGSFDYDASRRTYGLLGLPTNAISNGVSSDAVEFAVGVSTVSFEKDGFRVIPNASIRFMTGTVDSFLESGPGVNLAVGEQDLNSLLLDLGVDFEYQAQENLLLVGHIGYVTDFEDSDNTVSARFAASGPLASPFSVQAPGIDDEAFTLGLGMYYDINSAVRVGLTYRGEYRLNSESSQSIGIGASFGF